MHRKQPISSDKKFSHPPCPLAMMVTNVLGTPISVYVGDIREKQKKENTKVFVHMSLLNKESFDFLQKNIFITDLSSTKKKWA